MSIGIKRIYEPAQVSDGKRILVDRLWPRGVSREGARLDGWMKDIAPSTELRIWFGHENEKFDAFAVQYRHELETDPKKQQAVREMLEMSGAEKVTLLYGAKSAAVNHAAILLQYIKERID